MPVQPMMHWLDALIFNAQETARLDCVRSRLRTGEMDIEAANAHMAAQLARRIVARHRADGAGDEAAINEMLASPSPQLRAIGEDAAWRWRRAFAR